MHIINFLLHIASFQVLANAIANPDKPSSDPWFPAVVPNSNDLYFTESDFKDATNMNAKEFTHKTNSHIQACFGDNGLKIANLVVSPTYLRLSKKTFNEFHAAIDRLGKYSLWHLLALCNIEWSTFISENTMNSLSNLSIENQKKNICQPRPEIKWRTI
jgi:hypothetical protein